MFRGGLVGTIVLVWLLIGVLAAWQRDYFHTGQTNCATAGQIGLTALAGPLNYAGVNPQGGQLPPARAERMSSVAHV